jgi:putative inorganic carbon (HCO3(-)) transporter
VFLQVAADTGLPGLIAYLALLMLAWKQAWRLYRRGQGAARGMAIGFLAALVSSHVYGLADVVALGSKPGVLWWVLLALVAGVSGLGSGQASVDVVGRNKHA